MRECDDHHRVVSLHAVDLSAQLAHPGDCGVDGVLRVAGLDAPGELRHWRVGAIAPQRDHRQLAGPIGRGGLRGRLASSVGRAGAAECEVGPHEIDVALVKPPYAVASQHGSTFPPTAAVGARARGARARRAPLLRGSGRAAARRRLLPGDDARRPARVRGLRDPGGIKTWLFSIAARKAIDAHRASVRALAPTDEIDEQAVAPAPAAPAGEDDIWEQVRALPDKQRHAVTLRFRGDLVHREVADAMGTTEAAARRNVYEGLERLRKDM
jgi:RNA polymerase sigma factor (sigma-70 family)